MAYLFLTIAIVGEVIGTSALKASAQFTEFWPSVLTVAGYGTAFYALSFALKSIPVGIAYAIWSGVGIALISIVGFVVFRQSLDVAALLGITLIVAGVAVINLWSKSSVPIV